MLPWEGVYEFVAVAETDSFTAAGKRLAISTAQVSRQISQIENRLSTKLFYRTTRKVSLTEEGHIFYRHCRQVIDGLEEAERAISSLQNKPQGLIKLTAPVTYGESFVMPIVTDYMQQHPDVEVICELTNRQLDLVEGGYDLAIRLGRLPDSSMMAKRLTSREQFVCAAPDYINRFGAPYSLSELSLHNCLVGSQPHWHFNEGGQARSIKVQGNLQCSSGISLLNAAIKGLGIVQLPGYYVAEAIAAGKLSVILESYKQQQEGIWALYPHNRHLSPKVRLLVDKLAAELP
ncbi:MULTISPECIES: LysR substrate-binding domain-containing protein [unclassified Shewanella]|uniref:LysR substrate-binding domain-containing protein n=1 Tax=unclassified Shewanella TaxID=196818 RepID=UPI000C84A0BE|nr:MULTISPECIES: LysR substrate-binding domain-containing protein [unclassified Shewanella]MDO6619079.1 LysR substrate-binding domain-containing protein [Shewanella sp. 6_MG-2023]MDO6679018.1 LysR substrate-binding domain-containing protein [Shewanella sp. 4_MG-2023]MDO6776034.1 LysR substrate-binding domain-containing protein [Shewanella sp. 3_MG-2023]PMG40872.1 LysR family transcriptional regulator [Shewanella sp. 10N.286.52.B9]PMH99249.1 LysR family transcriptional regulator [Shewanella sp.